MYGLKKIGKVFTSKFVGTGPSSYKIIYRAAVSQMLRNTDLGNLEFNIAAFLNVLTMVTASEFVWHDNFTQYFINLKVGFRVKFLKSWGNKFLLVVTDVSEKRFFNYSLYMCAAGFSDQSMNNNRKFRQISTRSALKNLYIYLVSTIDD